MHAAAPPQGRAHSLSPTLARAHSQSAMGSRSDSRHAQHRQRVATWPGRGVSRFTILLSTSRPASTGSQYEHDEAFGSPTGCNPHANHDAPVVEDSVPHVDAHGSQVGGEKQHHSRGKRRATSSTHKSGRKATHGSVMNETTDPSRKLAWTGQVACHPL